MKNEQSAVKKFLEGGIEEQSFAFSEQVAPQEEENPQEEVIEEEKVEEEKPIPFHKDAKLTRYIEKEVEKRISQQLSSLESNNKRSDTQTEDEFKDVVESFATIIGNDTPEKRNALQALEKSLKGFDEKAIKRAEQKIEDIRRKEIEEERKAEEELNNAFESIEETYEVDLTSSKSKALRSEFASFVEKIAPKNQYGEVLSYPDMNSAWEAFSELKNRPTQPSRAKVLASRGLSRSSEAKTVPQKRVSWDAIDDLFDSSR